MESFLERRRYFHFQSFLFIFKMYGCYDAYMVYGICEDSYNLRLDDADLEEYSQYDIYLYAREVVRNHMTQAVYGCTLSLNVMTGQLGEPLEIQKQALQELYEKISVFHDANGTKEPTLGYFLVVGGDYNKEGHDCYMLDV